MTWPAATPSADLAAALLAVDPALGGIALRARASPAREAWVAAALALTGRPARRVPPGAGDDRLFGGLDLAATLAASRPVVAPGLVAEVGAGTLVLPMAERLPPARAVRLAQCWDGGAAFSVLALDEAEDAADGPPAALMDRLAFHLPLTLLPVSASAPPVAAFDPRDIAAARSRLARVGDTGDPATQLTRIAALLGIASLRAPRLALRAARAVAALAGERQVTAGAIELAAVLVLAPRATRLPQEEQEEQAPENPPPPEPAEGESDASGDGGPPPGDLVLEAVKAAIPPDLLARLAVAGALGSRAGAPGAGAGEDQKGPGRGRPAGARRGAPRGGARLDLVATLRNAAPWQPLRRRAAPPSLHGRVLVTVEDFRVRQYRQKREKVVIFVVDASGSAALTRLAETKGAIELMLAQAYVRREQVALISFRGAGAELLLPPTRSLVQAKRRLAGLPGGGATPLASGLLAALALSDRIARRGQAPHLALLTDGRANIARDGSPGRAAADADAAAAARTIRAARIPALVIDTAPRPQPAARAIAGELGGRYLPMPRADARLLSGALRSALDTAPGAT